MEKNTDKRLHGTITSLKKLLIFAILALFTVLAPVGAFCETVTLAWDANQEADLKGYILYYGTSSGNYTSNIDVGNNIQYTTPDLPDRTTYYFAVTAYNDIGTEVGSRNGEFGRWEARRLGSLKAMRQGTLGSKPLHAKSRSFLS